MVSRRDGGFAVRKRDQEPTTDAAEWLLFAKDIESFGGKKEIMLVSADKREVARPD